MKQKKPATNSIKINCWSVYSNRQIF